MELGIRRRPVVAGGAMVPVPANVVLSIGLKPWSRAGLAAVLAVKTTGKVLRDCAQLRLMFDI
jgi:hypothetical protein